MVRNCNYSGKQNLETMKKLITFLFAGAIVLSSCKKLENPIPNEPSNPGGVSKFSDLKTNPNFNWSTEKDFTIEVLGLKTLSPVKGTLTIISSDGKSTIYKGNHLMEESFTINTKVAINLKEVKLTFGSIEKSYTISGNKLQVDYIIDYPQED